jgi:hypothetical protein
MISYFCNRAFTPDNYAMLWSACSRKMYRKLHAWATVGDSPSGGSACDPVALLRERKYEDFDTEADFDKWFDRQLALFVASSCWETFWGVRVR